MGAHFPELIVVFVVALLIFGPKKLPEMGATLGRSIQQFKKSMGDITGTNEESLWSAEDMALEAKRLELQALDLELARKRAEVASYDTPGTLTPEPEEAFVDTTLEAYPLEEEATGEPERYDAPVIEHEAATTAEEPAESTLVASPDATYYSESEAASSEEATHSVRQHEEVTAE